MRLRQICLVAETLEPTVGQLCEQLGMDICFRDDSVAKYGLVNAVMPLGNEFLEVVAPVEENTAAGRYLDRRGGDGGYMVILHGDDAHADRERITALGVRAAHPIERPNYIATHFHPSDCAGILLSVDSVPGADPRVADAEWPPAGPDWRQHQRADKGLGLVGAELQHTDPDMMATLWGKILDLPVTERSIRLDGADLRFVAATDGRGPGLGGIDVKMKDRSTAGQELMIGGTRIYLV
ncbi:MAG: VOC family protein [Alphaproteobacteria bacterium]